MLISPFINFDILTTITMSKVDQTSHEIFCQMVSCTNVAQNVIWINDIRWQ